MNKFKDKKVLIFGLGLNQGGTGAAKFFASQEAQVRVTDLKKAQVLKPSMGQLKDFPIQYTLGQHKKDDIDWADLIIKNSAVKPGNSFIEYARKLGKRVEQDMGIFLDFVKPEQIIGVTGTKGKSTTSSLIYEVLKVADRNVVFAGNIGKSVLDTIDFVKVDTLVVLEISSFQLESFKTHKVSPKWAVITNITPDHLNYYTKMDEYLDAKKIIGKYQNDSDYLFLRKNDPITTNPDFLKGLKGQIIYFSKSDLPKKFHPNLLGEHNLENIAAAYKVMEIFNIDINLLLKTLANFKGIPFRMELIKEWNGFKIYNDTAATTPQATIQAIRALGNPEENKDQNIILICGGMNKNMDYKELSEVIDWYAKAVYFIEGDIVDDIICDMNEKGSIEGRFDSFEKLLLKLKKDIKERSFYFKRGDIILFSPAATSFNLFQNEWDRGRKFNKAVQKVFG